MLKGIRDYALLALRITLGWVFLWAGAEKLYSEITTGKLATAGYLQHAVRGPFEAFFKSLAGNIVVDAMVVWGLTLIGISLILGLLIRPSSFLGAVLMMFMYFSAFPPEHNPIFDEHIAYAVSLVVLASSGAGRIAGLDGLLRRTDKIAKHPLILRILG
ncbi:MAG: DoxX family protein [Candidatus Geothermarchaeales archaeon]